MKLLVTRGHIDAEPLAEALQGYGHDVIIDPMMSVNYAMSPLPDPSLVQALLITSANGIRALMHQDATPLYQQNNIPVFTVGDASARTAFEHGFESVYSAAGDVDDLARLVARKMLPEAGLLLHVAGTKVTGDLSGKLTTAGFVCRRLVLYEAVPSNALSNECNQALSEDQLDGVLFYSPRTVTIFLDLIQQAGLEKNLQNVTLYCLSEAVAQNASGVKWDNIRICEKPDQASMLRLLDRTA